MKHTLFFFFFCQYNNKNKENIQVFFFFCVFLDYTPTAIHSTILFFTIADLIKIDSMYQYSLMWFLNLFVTSIKNSEKSTLVDQRLINLLHHFTYSLYNHICCLLFEKDKLLFSFLLSIRLLQFEKKINNDEWQFFMTGGMKSTKTFTKSIEWLSQRSWHELNQLNQLVNFKNIIESFHTNQDVWKCVYNSNEPHKEKLPEPWQTKLEDFQRLCLIRCLRPDRILSAVKDFVRRHLGEKYVESSSSFDLTKFYQDSTCMTPIIFILSLNSNPMLLINKLANEIVRKNCHV